jgi:hypothetical protein
LDINVVFSSVDEGGVVSALTEVTPRMIFDVSAKLLFTGVSLSLRLVGSAASVSSSKVVFSCSRVVNLFAVSFFNWVFVCFEIS